MITLYSPYEIQKLLAEAVRARRKTKKMSRRILAEISKVPAPTITKFERTGQISLRQFLYLWQTVDRLDVFAEMSRPPEPVPRTIKDVLQE